VQREELVLLLIQLRRSQTKLEQMRVWVRDKLVRIRPDEKAYRIQFVVFYTFLPTSSLAISYLTEKLLSLGDIW